MIEIKGKYETAKIFTDDIEQEAISQIYNLMNQPFAKGTHARFMPDVHAGKGCTVGTTMLVTDKICPNLIGVDIGCAMLLVNLGKIEIDLPLFDKIVNKYVPSGFNIHEKAIYSDTELQKQGINLEDAADVKSENLIEYYKKSIGTLGGGNHFIELNKDDEDNVYLVIHTGSRNFGKKVCEYYQDRAIKSLTGKNSDYHKEQLSLISKLKSEGRQSEIETKLKELHDNYQFVPKELAFLDKNTNDDFNRYIKDMHIAQRYASLNRKTIAQLILLNYFNEVNGTKNKIVRWTENNFKIMGLDKEFNYFETMHNYLEINEDQIVLRKGAISCKKGEMVLIPLNMRDGSLICIGKGNPDWNLSGPHGAGRRMSRSQAKDNISLEEFKESMKDIYSSSVNQSTIDEAPMAYKDAVSIMVNIQDTADVIKQIKPIYNFKASEQEPIWKTKK